GSLKDTRIHFVSLAACARRETELLGLLSPTERDRAREINHPRAHLNYIASRAMIREVLTDFVDQMVASNEWVFNVGPYGKPQVLIPGAPSPRFSISYTTDTLTIAVSQKFELGVDIESMPGPADREVPWQVLSSPERRAINALPPAEQFMEFLRLWTLKEAYTKYFGMGAALDFRHVEVDLDPLRATMAEAPRNTRLADPVLHQQLLQIDGNILVFALASGRPRA
ncbi:MAG: 4'-phosphopantetheinyl transferase superfamily protein, partial [Devosia sp.]